MVMVIVMEVVLVIVVAMVVVASMVIAAVAVAVGATIVGKEVMVTAAKHIQVFPLIATIFQCSISTGMETTFLQIQ